jgi:hypothetical protein
MDPTRSPGPDEYVTILGQQLPTVFVALLCSIVVILIIVRLFR